MVVLCHSGSQRTFIDDAYLHLEDVSSENGGKMAQRSIPTSPVMPYSFSVMSRSVGFEICTPYSFVDYYFANTKIIHIL